MSSNIIMRTEKSFSGLRDMIAYIGGKLSLMELTAVEVGVYEGDATLLFADAFLKVYAVDPWRDEHMNVHDPATGGIVESEDVYQRFCEKTRGIDNIMILRKTSKQAALLCSSQKFDFVYIDAIHTYEAVKEDIKLWKPKVYRHGYIGGHDYSAKFPGVVQAVDEALGGPDKVFQDTSWIKKVM